MTTPFFSVDYTSRDYASILQDLIDQIPTVMPEWTSRSSSDFGIALLELFAYTADGLHYYADRIANESFIGTASQRSSLLRLARMLNYVPTGNVAAEVTLVLSNSTGSAVTVVAGTKVITTATAGSDSPVVFETVADAVVPAAVSAVSGTSTVLARQGSTVADPSEQIGISDGTLDQQFSLFNTPVIEGSVAVFVDEGGVDVWRYVPNLLLSGPGDRAYTLLTDEDDTVVVRFGDGSNGKIPDRGATITATYRVGGGSLGNVAASTLTRITTSVPAGITVTNAAPATGGADAETADSIRINAPLALQSLNRAVTLSDYANLAVTYPQVAKARATSSVPTAVNLYVAPGGGGGLDDGGDPTPAFAAIKASVLAYINDRKPVATTVTILNPTYVEIDITVTLHLLPQFSQARVEAAASTALQALLDFDNVVFGDTLTPSDVHAVLNAVDGVSYTDLTLIARGGGTGTAAVTLAAGEIPIAGNFTINTTGGIA